MKTSRKTGLSPGSLVYVGEKNYDKPTIDLMDYSDDHLEEKQIHAIEECFEFKEKTSNTWININGLHDEDIIETIGNHYGIHPLVLEDILHTEQRPKIEFFEDHIFIVLKMMDYDTKENKIEFEQLSLILGKNFVITFQEERSHLFEPLKKRIRDEKSKIRQMGSDYLAHGILDIVIDNYFAILERFGDLIEIYEDDLMVEPSTETLNNIYQMKRELLFLRKSVFPLKDVITKVERSEIELINEKTKFYMKDIYDHIVQVVDTVDTQRDLVVGLLDLYSSSVGNRMNEVMKVLTMISTIFIPLTFIAGVYGMNFKYLPEIYWKYGYFIILGVMLIVAILMLFFFKRRNWI